MTLYRTLNRRFILVALICVLSVGVITTVSLVGAQEGTGQQITVGDIVSGLLNSQNFTQVYTLSASAGDTISINVTTEVADLNPVIVVTDGRGNVVAQDANLSTETTATISDLELPTTTTYSIMVMRGSGATGDAAGSFRLELTGFQQVGGQSVTLTNGGIVFDLLWNAAVNLNLEVRDPVGGTVHRNSPGSPSGGTLDADINLNCDAAIATEPTETIAWPVGTVPVGSYEVIIYYEDGCNVGGPQLFTLNATVDNDTTQSIIGTLNPTQQYLARLVVAPDGGWRLENGGVNAGLGDVTLFQNEIASANPIAIGSAVSGLITNSAPAQAYSFTAQAGTNVNITAQAQSGSLDTYLVLLGPDNTPITSNDDDAVSTNSAISLGLLNDGTYTILVTRYGLTIGGTEGEYNLTLTGSTTAVSDTPQPTQAASTATNITGQPLTGSTATAIDSLPNGAVEIKLEWATEADLQLLVRDPQGGTVYDDFPIVQSGGVLAEDGNVRCENVTSTPISYIYWPPNRLIPGTYEIEVWYQNTCDDPRLVNFALSVDIQDQNLFNVLQASSPNARYMITFTIGQNGEVSYADGGFFNMEDPATLNYQAQLINADPIAYGQTVSGSITGNESFKIYAFEGQAGDSVSISMNARSGTLDPALYLISPDQLTLRFNDDVTPVDNPNSLIDKVTLPSTGTYYIIATHYGLNYGGTQGTFDLMLVQD